MFGFSREDIMLTAVWMIVCISSYQLLRKIKSPIGKTKKFDEYTMSLMNSLVIVILGYDLVLFSDNETFLEHNTEQQVLYVIICILWI